MGKAVTVDEQLLRELRHVSRIASDEDAVNEAVRDFVSRRQTNNIIDLFGQVDYAPDYDPKALRRGDLKDVEERTD